MSDIGICKYCKYIDKDIIEKPCLHCAANLGAFEVDLSEHDAKVRTEVIEEYKHNLKETFNNEFPINYRTTQPYFTLDNVRVLADAVAREMKEQKE